MMELINKLQKDVKKFQKTIQAESDELVKKIKHATSKSNIEQTRRTMEKVIQNKISQFEPALLRLVKDMKENAAKAGIDLGDLEGKVQKATKAAKEKMTSRTRSSSQKKSKAKAKAKSKAQTQTAKPAKTKAPAAKRTKKKASGN